MIGQQTCQGIAARIPVFVEGELPSEDVEAVESHLAECAACRQQAEQFSAMQELAQNALGPAMLNPNFEEQATMKLSRLQQNPETHAPVRRRAGPQDETGDVEAYAYEDDEEERVPAPAVGFFDSLSQQFGVAPWWMISGAFHALLLMLLTLIGMVLLRGLEEDTVIVTDLEEKKEPEKVVEPKERTVIPKPVPVEESEIVADQPQIVTHEEVEIADHVETPDDSDAADSNGEDGMSDVFLGGSGAVAALGLGGGGRAGAFGRPGGAGGRLRRATAGGGGKATESAVDKALEWLARHQSPDGSWKVKQLEGTHNYDPGVTGLALLAFLGAGHTEKVGKFRENVVRAIDYIISEQDDKGAIADKGHWHHCGGCSYHHAICGMALAEASAMARIPRTIEAAQKAINYSTEVHQVTDGLSDKFGWRYKPKDRHGDLSNSGWFIMQLKSAKVAGLQVDPASFDGAIKYLDHVMADPVNVKKMDDGYDSGGHRYGYDNKKPTINTTSIGVLCRLFTGTPPEQVRGAAEWLLQTEPPRWDASMGPGRHGHWPMYYCYYTTLTMFQVGGEHWKRWNSSMKTMLIQHQRKDGDADGSWDPLSSYEKRGGRAYSTALGALCLEVYYRYLPMYR